MGHAKSLRAFRSKIEEVFSEVGRGLAVDNAQIVFDPTTVWGNRQGYHNMLVVMPRSVPPSLLSTARRHSASPRLAARFTVCQRHRAQSRGSVFSNHGTMHPSNA
jgi:hypothetical protein